MNCPHCNAVNAEPGRFCEHCGKALPVGGGGPQIVRGGGLASSEAGRTLQSNELMKAAKKAAGALLAVAVLQALFGGFIVYMMKKSQPGADLTAVAVVVFGIAALFLGLYFWARRSPLPAAISGLVVFVTLHALEAVSNPASIGQGLLVKIIVIVVLARAISAGMKHRALQRAATPG